MLDIFLNKGWVIMSNKGKVRRTPALPSTIRMLTDEDGIINFYYTYKFCLIIIDPNQFIDK